MRTPIQSAEDYLFAQGLAGMSSGLSRDTFDVYLKHRGALGHSLRKTRDLLAKHIEADRASVRRAIIEEARKHGKQLAELCVVEGDA